MSDNTKSEEWAKTWRKCSIQTLVRNANKDKCFGVKMKLFIPYQPANLGIYLQEIYARMHRKMGPTFIESIDHQRAKHCRALCTRSLEHCLEITDWSLMANWKYILFINGKNPYNDGSNGIVCNMVISLEPRLSIKLQEETRSRLPFM